MTSSVTDAQALAELGERLAQERLRRNLTQEQLAAEAGISRSTVRRLEAGGSTQMTNLIRVLRALDLLANLDVLVPDPRMRPLEALKHDGQRRRRASGRRDQTMPKQPFRWGDEE